MLKVAPLVQLVALLMQQVALIVQLVTPVVHHPTLTALNQIVISTQRFLQQETFKAKDLNHFMCVLR